MEPVFMVLGQSAPPPPARPSVHEKKPVSRSISRSSKTLLAENQTLEWHGKSRSDQPRHESSLRLSLTHLLLGRVAQIEECVRPGRSNAENTMTSRWFTDFFRSRNAHLLVLLIWATPLSGCDRWLRKCQNPFPTVCLFGCWRLDLPWKLGLGPWTFIKSRRSNDLTDNTDDFPGASVT